MTAKLVELVRLVARRREYSLLPADARARAVRLSQSRAMK